MALYISPIVLTTLTLDDINDIEAVNSQITRYKMDGFRLYYCKNVTHAYSLDETIFFRPFDKPTWICIMVSTIYLSIVGFFLRRLEKGRFKNKRRREKDIGNFIPHVGIVIQAVMQMVEGAEKIMWRSKILTIVTAFVAIFLGKDGLFLVCW